MAKKLDIKLTPKKITFYFYFFTLILSIILLFFIVTFLYKNFYQTITQSKEILILKEKVIIESINIDKFNEVVKKIADKTTLRKINNLNNPFD